MCGRFPLGLDAQSHRTAIERWMDRFEAQRRQNRPNHHRQHQGGSQSRSSSTQAHDDETQPYDALEGAEDEPSQVPSIESTPETELFRPSYNVAPSTRVPVMRLEKPVRFRSSKGATAADDEADEGDDLASKPPSAHKLLIQPMKWGLLPRSTKVLPPYADALKTINARDDTVLSGRGMWPPLLSSGKRCVVWAQGFYEWLKKPDGSRLPHFVGMQDEGVPGRVDAQGKEKGLMPMAGLWESCQLDGEPEPLFTFTIITTESNKQLGFLHDRMPVILPDVSSVLLWLGAHPSSTSPASVSKLLRPYSGELECYRVPTEVGKVGNNDANFILPLSQRKDGIMAAFGRAKGGATESKQAGVKKEEEEEREKVDANSETHAPVPSEIKREPSDEKPLKTEARPSDSGPSASRQPSSKFSPEPFNPPTSPHRPKGGYSRPDADAQSVYTKGNSGPTALETLLEKQKKRAADFPVFPDDDGERGFGLSPSGGTKRSKVVAPPPEGKGAGGGGKAKDSAKAKGSKDIRSFFGSASPVGKK